LFIAETGTTAAAALSVNNTCADNVIPPPANLGTRPVQGNTNAQFPCHAGSSILCGTNYFDEFDPAPDSCGDTSSADNGGGPGQEIVTLEIHGFQCPASTAGLPQCTVGGVTGPCAVLPNCTSWQVPGKVIQCQAPSGVQSYNINAVPGDKSKCNCESTLFPVIVQTPSVTVNKYCTTTATSGLNAACSSGLEGADPVTYTVKVSNTSTGSGSITVNQICDNRYGAVLDSTKNGGTGTCPAGSLGTVDSSACTPFTVAFGSNDSCTFVAHTYGDPGPATVTDQVSVAGSSQFAGSFGPTLSNTVTVTPTEPPSAATVTKGLGAPPLTAACVTGRFTVGVKNTTDITGCPTGFCNETETLTSLIDDQLGNIAPTPGSAVKNADCFTSSSGVTIAPGDTYSCHYDGEFCGTLGTVPQVGTGTCDQGTHQCTAGNVGAACTTNSQCDTTCTGLTHTNYVTAAITDDENNAVTPTRNTLHTTVCLSPYTQSQ
jgi:hypothetical protein